MDTSLVLVRETSWSGCGWNWMTAYAPKPSLFKVEPCDLLMDDDRSSQRKANKPLMEKRRRARINKSLMELKSILVESLKKSTPGHSKWEKADILEMTVQYLQCLKNQQQATKSDPLSVGQFIAGFSECIRQIRKFSLEMEGSTVWDPQLQDKLTDFLLSYLKNFSDDATTALQHQRHLSPQRSPRLKGSSGDGSDAAPNSPTTSSLSPKSQSLSPRSNGDSEFQESNFPDASSYLRLTVPGLAANNFQFSSPESAQETLLLPLMKRDLHPEPQSQHDDLSASNSAVWRPW